ncbi:hypothetical protein TNCV_523811 [Trichonephila clavipes]|nr:hypothetical protein TNCV_523811 [Trichonephila clavipes]
MTLKTCRMEGLMHVKTFETQIPPLDGGWQTAWGAPQMPSSLLDRSSKLRVTRQPRVGLGLLKTPFPCQPSSY